MMTGAKSSKLVHFRIMTTNREQRRAYLHLRLDALGMESCEMGINRPSPEGKAIPSLSRRLTLITGRTVHRLLTSNTDRCRAS